MLPEDWHEDETGDNIVAQGKSMVVNTAREKVILEVFNAVEERKQRAFEIKRESERSELASTVFRCKSRFQALADKFFNLDSNKLRSFDLSMLKELSVLIFRRSKKMVIVQRLALVISTVGCVSFGPSLIMIGSKVQALIGLLSVLLIVPGILFTILTIVVIIICLIERELMVADKIAEKLTGISGNDFDNYKRYLLEFRSIKGSLAEEDFYEAIKKDC